MYGDIMAIRQTGLDQPLLEGAGARALDPLTKEMVYLAVSGSNQCPHCRGGMANETNRLAGGYPVEIVERFRPR